MERYTIGIDFGTLSGRALLVRVSDGREMGSASLPYRHGVMDDLLPTPEGDLRLPPNWALEHPADYLEVFSILPGLLRACGVTPDEVIGLGVDSTTCTIFPTDAEGTPLCTNPRFASDPHAYAKLWKHHAAQKYAARITETAKARGEGWLSHYGGAIQSEWALPKLLETLTEDPELADAAAAFTDAADWLVWQLTGARTRNSCVNGYKNAAPDGTLPSDEYLAALDPRFPALLREKLCSAPVVPVGSRAGALSDQGARLTGLLPGTAVAAGHADAHVAPPSARAVHPGEMFAMIGTSTCMLVSAEEFVPVPGVCGIVKNGIVPGLWGYEAGLGCVGDTFAWFADRCVTASLKAEADARSIHPITLLSEKMTALRPGESGLLALNWWNGNRCLLNDSDLSGMLVGLNLNTRPEEIFRALVEATAFGTRAIIENYRSHGVPVLSFTASGGIAQKNPAVMQIYADILGMEIRVGASKEGPALGSAIYAAAAAGTEMGGYADIFAASEAMGALSDTVYRPDPANRRVYDALYREYLALTDYFGRGGNDVMKRLLTLRAEARSGSPSGSFAPRIPGIQKSKSF